MPCHLIGQVLQSCHLIGQVLHYIITCYIMHHALFHLTFLSCATQETDESHCGQEYSRWYRRWGWVGGPQHNNSTILHHVHYFYNIFPLQHDLMPVAYWST